MPKSIIFSGFIQHFVPFAVDILSFSSFKKPTSKPISIMQNRFTLNESVLIKIFPTHFVQKNTVSNENIETIRFYPGDAFFSFCWPNINGCVAIILRDVAIIYWSFWNCLNFSIQVKGTKLENTITH